MKMREEDYLLEVFFFLKIIVIFPAAAAEFFDCFRKKFSISMKSKIIFIPKNLRLAS